MSAAKDMTKSLTDILNCITSSTAATPQPSATASTPQPILFHSNVTNSPIIPPTPPPRQCARTPPPPTPPPLPSTPPLPPPPGTGK